MSFDDLITPYIHTQSPHYQLGIYSVMLSFVLADLTPSRHLINGLSCRGVDGILFYNMLAMRLDEDLELTPVTAHLNPNRTDMPKFPPACHMRRFDAQTVTTLGSVKIGPAQPYMVHFENETALWTFASTYGILAVAAM